MKADKLQYGDTIGIISPSHIAAKERYETIISVLESLGFKVKTGKNLYKSTYGYSASEKERAEDLNTMAADNEVKMIFFGGGEGGNELLPYIDYDLIQKHPKIYLSYSDGTTLINAIYARTGLCTYYGQAPGNFEDLRHYDYSQFISHFIEGPVSVFKRNSSWETVNGGVGEGLLVGGYTRNFSLLLNHSYFPVQKEQPYILFLEDHENFSQLGEVSAYLSHIEQCEIIRQIKGLLFGHYAKVRFPDLFRRLERFGLNNGIPVVYCDDFGHGSNHGILPIGCRARLEGDQKSLHFTEPTIK